MGNTAMASSSSPEPPYRGLAAWLAAWDLTCANPIAQQSSSPIMSIVARGKRHAALRLTKGTLGGTQACGNSDWRVCVHNDAAAAAATGVHISLH